MNGKINNPSYAGSSPVVFSEAKSSTDGLKKIEIFHDSSTVECLKHIHRLQDY